MSAEAVQEQKKTFWEEWRGFFLFLAIMIAFRVAIADWNHIPSGSMRPTLIEGDRIWVNKLAYDIKVPYTDIVLKTMSDPERGDVIVFRSPVDGTRLVKRIVGLPGDNLNYSNHRLFINGQEVDYREYGQEVDASVNLELSRGYDLFEEMLPGNSHPAPQHPRAPAEALRPFNWQLGDSEYLVLGDNRDHSSDSRYIGPIDRSLIIGRTRAVVLSFNRDNYYLPRASRFFLSLP